MNKTKMLVLAQVAQIYFLKEDMRKLKAELKELRTEVNKLKEESKADDTHKQ